MKARIKQIWILSVKNCLHLWHFMNTTAYPLGRYEPSFPPTKELHCWIVSECDEFVVLLAWNLSLSCTLTPLWNQVMVGLGSAMIAQWNTRVEPSSSWRMVGLDANVGAMPSTCLHKKDICGLVQSYRAPVANLIKHITIVNYDAGVVLTTYLPILQL